MPFFSMKRVSLCVHWWLLGGLVCASSWAADTPSALRMNALKRTSSQDASVAEKAAEPEKHVAPVHAIAMNGAPLGPEDFTHFSTYNPAAPKGGEVRVPVLGTVFDTLNPFVPSGLCATGLGIYAHYTFDTLTERAPDEPYALYGRLAESIEMPANRAWIIFNLRKEARFQDGSPVTAADVKFTFETLARSGTPARRLLGQKISRVEILSPLRVKFSFHTQVDGTFDRELPFIMAGMPVLSEKSLQGVDFVKTGLTPLMGSGPYKITKVEPGRSVTYTRDPNYWGSHLACVKGLYNFEKVTFEYFSNETVGFEAFKSGEVHHWTESNTGRWASGYQFPAILEGKIVREKLIFKNASSVMFCAFNLATSCLQDRRVRQALSLLFDFEWVNRTLFDGTLKRTESHFGDTVFTARGAPSEAELQILKTLPDVPPEAYLPVSEPPQTDGSGNLRSQIRAAHALLQEAGYVFEQGRVVHAVTRTPLALTLILNNPRNEKIAAVYERALAKAGIALTIRVLDSAQYQKRVDERDYDLVFYQYGSSSSPGTEQKLYYGSYFAQGASRNYASIRSKAIDQACDQLVSVDSQEKLILICRVLDRLLRAGKYMLPIFYRNSENIAYWKFLQHPPLDGVVLPPLMAWWRVLDSSVAPQTVEPPQKSSFLALPAEIFSACRTVFGGMVQRLWGT